ncbi:MAG: hypothetical protein ACYS0I_04900, partial [Planctomycetota bacterium]
QPQASSGSVLYAIPIFWASGSRNLLLSLTYMHDSSYCQGFSLENFKKKVFTHLCHIAYLAMCRYHIERQIAQKPLVAQRRFSQRSADPGTSLSGAEFLRRDTHLTTNDEL